MNLLTDVFFLDNLKIIEESKKTGTMTIEGTFQRAEQPNNNKRVYPKTVLTNQVQRLQELVDARRLCGELDHPTNETVKLSNASHLITKLWMEGNEVYGRAELLNTPAGKVAQTLVNDGVSVGISSRGLGTLSESANEGGYKTVNDDFKLVTFDLVADPSTKGAYPKLSEATEYINDTSRKALREKTYVTLLKQELGQRFGDNDMNLNRLEEGESEGQRMTRMSREQGKKRLRAKTLKTSQAHFAKEKEAKAAKLRQQHGVTDDEIKGRVITHRSGQKLRWVKKGTQGERGFENAHTEYDPEEVLQVLENNIRRFISENEDPQLAAQFVRDHSEELMEGFLSKLAGAVVGKPGESSRRRRFAGKVAGRLIPGTKKRSAELRRAERSKARAQRGHSDQGGTPTSPSRGLQGKQTAEPEGGDRNLAARVDRKTDNFAADRKARRAAGEARKDAAADQTLAVAKKKTIGAAKNVGKMAMGKLKQGWHSAAAKVKGGVAGAQEKVSRGIAKGATKLSRGIGAEITPTQGGTGSFRAKADASAAKAAAAKKSVGAEGRKLSSNLRGGVLAKRTNYQKKGKDFRGDAGGAMPQGSGEGSKKKAKQKTTDLAHTEQAWNTEMNYQMMRLHENIQRFNG